MKKGTAVVLIAAGLLIAGFSELVSATPFMVVQEKEVSYTEIEVEDVPEMVNEAVKEYFTDYIINKAYLGEDGSYKLEVSKEDIQYVLYYKENGELIKVEQPEANATG